MEEVVFEDGTSLVFDKGKKDDWCVYYKFMKAGRQQLIAPLDREYFDVLIRASLQFGYEVVWADFCSIYDKTHDEWMLHKRKSDPMVFQYIYQMTQKYGSKQLVMQKTFSILYMAMLAEYRYVGTKLDKLIKKLAVYRILFCGISAFDAANENKNKQWHKIYNDCVRYGLVEENF